VTKEGQRSDPGLIAMLTQVSKALHRRTSEELLGMRLKQFLALSYVRDHPGISQQELEGALLMDANSVVLLLNDLETGHLVLRRRAPTDRRRHTVELTDAGAQAYERAEKARESLEEEILADLTPAERATLYELVRRVLDGLLQPVSEPRS
jgi:DNA-binding MarR family transcriptional regulator